MLKRRTYPPRLEAIGEATLLGFLFTGSRFNANREGAG
jgi:hypothetical protein